MSALTDLFTAMANKIRSKTGGSDTYTPAEMVSDGIDDVYDAGVAAGTTPTQTKSVTAGTSQVTVTPDTGYALSSVTVDPTPSETKTEGPNVSTNKEVTPTSGKLLSKVTITPQTHTGTYTPAANTAANDMGANHDKRYVNTSGMIVPSGNKAITSNGTGIDVSSYATASVSVSGTSITPSNSSPASMSSGSLYTPSASGYAISSYSSVTPSNSSPVSLSSGSIYKMGGAGKAVASVTSVAPSNSSPATLTSGTVYKPSANGVAISSYSSITPSSSSQSVSSGSIYKMGGNGVVVDALPTINSITPSNSSPVSMSSGSNYSPTASGYAISSYDNVTPTAEGAYFSSGMKKMASSGYAYSSKAYKYGWDSETTLWTNSNATSAFASQTITVSDMSSYEYIKLYYKIHRSESTVKGEAIFPLNIFKTMTEQNVSYTPTMAFGGRNSSGSTYVRRIFYVSNTQIKFTTAQQTGVSGSDTSWAIPTKITGLK